jgi:hypothetical protein
MKITPKQALEQIAHELDQRHMDMFKDEKDHTAMYELRIMIKERVTLLKGALEELERLKRKYEGIEKESVKDE